MVIFNMIALTKLLWWLVQLLIVPCLAVEFVNKNNDKLNKRTLINIQSWIIMLRSIKKTAAMILGVRIVQPIINRNSEKKP